MKRLFTISVTIALCAHRAFAQDSKIEIRATNPIPITRYNETLEIPAKDLTRLGAKSLNLIHVKDSNGKELVCQAIDTDGDELRTFDSVLFQSDFAAGETKIFTASVGAKQVYPKEEYRAFGRFVRERFDDFAWENDRIAHRTYGQALESWKGEPLASSTIDIWSKRTPRMVINDWYLTDDYHVDHGEGADYYSAGVSRGCGGSGIWAADRLWVSKNFTHSNVLANGPIRVLFELTYAPISVKGVDVSETKRISLDAGQQLDRFESHYQMADGRPTVGIGMKKVLGEKLEVNPEEGWMAKWEVMEKGAGNQGLALITGPKLFSKQVEDSLNHLVLMRANPSNVAIYWAGFCWDKAGRFTTQEAWLHYVSDFAKCVSAPIVIRVASN
ncbi:MAG: DUF4861 family protein [Akkermansiaceae bacterium]|nr:DUF4861 family protein [Akkermansiaceae bacterium]